MGGKILSSRAQHALALSARAYAHSHTGNASKPLHPLIQAIPTGRLFFGAYGKSAGAGIHLVKLPAGLASTVMDFFVVCEDRSLMG